MRSEHGQVDEQPRGLPVPWADHHFILKSPPTVLALLQTPADFETAGG